MVNVINSVWMQLDWLKHWGGPSTQTLSSDQMRSYTYNDIEHDISW